MAEAMAGTTVEVPREVQVVAAVSFGISNRPGPRLLCWPLRRPLRHRSSSVNNNNDSNRLVGQLHPRRLPVASRVPLPTQVMVVVGGTRVDASCAYLEWWCPHPTRHESWAGATYTSTIGGKNSSFRPSISRLCTQCPSNGFLPRDQPPIRLCNKVPNRQQGTTSLLGHSRALLQDRLCSELPPETSDGL